MTLADVIAAFLGIALIFYSVFGGADFGAGVLELFAGSRRRRDQVAVMSRALGPVWEANHVWLILALVILFNGFPRAYAEISIALHLPLTAMLVGIIFRGTAFTFRHYDAIQDDSQAIYTRVFIAGSVLAPLMLGLAAGALSHGAIDPSAATYYGRYVAPWANWFSLMVGVFFLSLSVFVAAVYLVGETDDLELVAMFAQRARLANCVALIAGGLVFAAGFAANSAFIERFSSRGASLGAFALATLLLVPIWRLLGRARAKNWLRILVSAQVSLILLGWFGADYPTIVHLADGQTISIHADAAPEAVLDYLLWALIVGLVLIVPALAYLLKVFKFTRPSRP